MHRSMLSREAGRKGRVAALATSAALVAGAGGLVMASAPAANAVDVSKDFDYKCDTVAAALPLGVKDVGVNAKVSLPAEVGPNQLIPTRKTTITLTLPEDLRNATYGLLSARKVDGYSNDASVTLTDSGAWSKKVGIANLKATNVTVPPNVGDPWIIPTKGDVPAIKVPASASGTATVSMPSQFTIKATLFNASGGKVGGDDAVNMDCVIESADDTLATMPISGPAYVDASMSASARGIVYGKPGTIVAKLNKAVGGRVDAYLGKRKIGSSAVRGTSATIPLRARVLSPGRSNVTLRHVGGQANLNPVAARNVRVTVAKATAAIRAQVKPRGIRAKRTRASVVVTIVSSAPNASGPIKAQVGRKVVGKSTVRRGKATIRLQPFARAGKNRVSLTYSGSKLTRGAKKTIVVNVRR